jgi:ferric-dicitrate binding protein FerR (iron transport regulator)
MEIAGLFGSARHNLSKAEIEERSAQLLVKLIRCPDAVTREEIYRWIEEHPANAVAFAEAEAAWEATEYLKANCIETAESVSAEDNAALPRQPAPEHVRDDDRRAAVRARRRSADRPD